MYICKTHCPEMDGCSHCKVSDPFDESNFIVQNLRDYGCCPVGNIPIWEEIKEND